jgi:NAD-dependent dihydropyrimidine dehydrogenase PreA subunit
VTYVITDACTKDGACLNVCPVDCIHPRLDEGAFEIESKLYIDPDVCIDCGACVPVCPVDAIFHEDELPQGHAHFAEVDAEWYRWRRAAAADAQTSLSDSGPVPTSSVQRS